MEQGGLKRAGRTQGAPERGRHVFWFKGLRSEGAGGAPVAAPGEIPDIHQVRKACSLMLDEVAQERGEKDGYELSLLLVGNDEMRLLNREHRGLDKPTDVLSFPLLGAPPSAGREDETEGPSARTESVEFVPAFWVPGPIPIGDIVIARETCEAQAEEVGHSVRDEFWRLLVHGVLHLFGYDHETSPEEELRMQKREDQILDLLSHTKL